MRGRRLLAAVCVLGLSVRGVWADNHAVQSLPPGTGEVSISHHEGYWLVNVSAVRRAVNQPIESLLVSRATEVAAQRLCNFTDKPGLRLEAKLSGVAMTSSSQVGEMFSVTVRVPEQRPQCRVLVVEQRLPAGNTPDEPPAAREPPQPVVPPASSSRSTIVREFKVEY